MIEQIARHGGFVLDLRARGDCISTSITQVEDSARRWGRR